MEKSKINIRKVVFTLCTLLFIFVGLNIIQVPSGLNRNDLRAFGLLVIAIVLWVVNIFPMSITAFIVILLLPICKIMSMNTALEKFGINPALFVMATSTITIGLTKTSIPKKIMYSILKISKNNPNKIVIGFGLLTAFFSSFVSGLVACAIFTNLGLCILKETNSFRKESNFAKCIMLSIPVCAGIGGIITPAGTASNIIIMQTLQEKNVAMSFIKWCELGIPLGLVTTIIFLLFLVKVHKPEKLSNDIVRSIEVDSKYSFYEIKLVIMIVSLIILWIIGSWVPILSTTFVALLGMVIMFFPCIQMITWKEFCEGVNWNLVLSTGLVSIIMSVVASTNLIRWFTDKIFHNINSMPNVIFLFIVSILILLMRALIPTTVAAITLLAPILIELADLSGESIVVLLYLLAYWAATEIILIYTEPIFLITYSYDCYTQKDLAKVGIPISIVMSVILAIFLPSYLKFLGLY